MQKQMGAPDDAERFCVFGDSHGSMPGLRAVEACCCSCTADPPWWLDTGRIDEPCELKKFRQSSCTADLPWWSDNGLHGREQRSRRTQ